MSNNTAGDRRDWNWDRDGALEGGHYVATREVTIRNGPSAGQEKLIFDFHVGLEDEEVSVWETAVLRSRFLAELRTRGKPDFEPGERITIRPLGKREGANGAYMDFEVEFEHAAPRRSAVELLSAGAPARDDEGFPSAPSRGEIDF